MPSVSAFQSNGLWIASRSCDRRSHDLDCVCPIAAPAGYFQVTSPEVQSVPVAIFHDLPAPGAGDDASHAHKRTANPAHRGAHISSPFSPIQEPSGGYAYAHKKIEVSLVYDGLASSLG